MYSLRLLCFPHMLRHEMYHSKSLLSSNQWYAKGFILGKQTTQAEADNNKTYAHTQTNKQT
jgi:hypothetical protein